MSDKISAYMERRLEARSKTKYIVDTIFPAGSMHLIGGPSGIGKTTWLLQMLHQWDTGQDVLGYKPHRCPWMYISIDRQMSETDRTMARLGLQDWDAPICSIEQIMARSKLTGGLDGEPDIFKIVKSNPGIELFVIEGLQGLMPSTNKGQSQNKCELLWAIRVRDIILSTGKTIIGITHSPKMKEEYEHGRSNFLGSQSFIGSCSTCISFDLPPEAKLSKGMSRTTDRMVTIMGRDFPDLYCTYTRADNGAFVLDSEVSADRAHIVINDQDKELVMHSFLSAKTHANRYDSIPLAQLKKWSVKAGMSEPTFFRWLKTAMEKGELVKIEKGLYQLGEVAKSKAVN